MPIDPRTPILVGAAAVTQRVDDPLEAREALDLMDAAAVAAARDAGDASLLGSAHLIAVPEGTWGYRDPARLLALRWGADASSTRAAVGVLQQDVIGDTCALISAGGLDVAVIVGGEAQFRTVQARAVGVEASETAQDADAVADRQWETASLGIHDLELERNVVTPATAYALIANARSASQPGGARGNDPGIIYERFAATAAANPLAWDRTSYTADQIVAAAPSNRMISTPYTKLLCSQWNVDQAAALIICSVAEASRRRIRPERWVFPWSSAVHNDAVPLLQRSPAGGCSGAAAVFGAAVGDIGLDGDDIRHIELYSCFPVAVQIYADALGVAPDDERPGTLTGGMSFAGGPLNNYVLQAMPVMVERLRADPGSFGLSTSVSGFLHKQGAGVWSARPPAGRFVHREVRDRSAEGTRPVDGGYRGPAEVVSWTVEHASGVPKRAVVIVDTPEGARTIAASGATDTCAEMLHGGWVGVSVRVGADGSFQIEG